MTPISQLDQALEDYRKAFYRTPAGSAPPDAASFRLGLSADDRQAFDDAVRSASAYMATADYSAPPNADQTLDSDANSRPDQTGEYNRETKSLGGDGTPDPNRGTRTK